MVTVSELRQSFLEFFAAHQHTIVPSSPLVPHNDPTLMFTAAGMVQFKEAFTGLRMPDYTRAVSSQKCVRAGGKHNDLDNVGYTARHHTFFEMLGNFSFGDYFKDTAIELAWKFLTETLALPKEKLYVTVYHTDDEAFHLWKKIAGLGEERIIRISTNDNFWMMGETGPCGPCSEIFYDHGAHIPGGLPGTPDADGDRYVEIWNLVFMQYEQQGEGKRIALPKPSIDTGMGLERISAVLQGVHDNYDIDLFKHLIQASQEFTKVKSEGNYAASHRIIADHLRSSCFLMADGVLPSNEGRGYVLRRIMRRAMRHVQHLGCREPLLYRLVPTLLQEMGRTYPELERAEALMTETLRLEEERFGETLGRGLKLLETEITGLGAQNLLSGEVAFKLYDTYGFPLDLTKDILRQRNLSVDEKGFELAMQKQREQARAAWAGSGEKATQEIWFNLRSKLGATEFLGYKTTTASATLQGLIQEGTEVSQAKTGDTIAFIVNQTPFYGESGGQMGDHGQAKGPNNLRIHITDTKKFLEDLIVHTGIIEQGCVAIGDTLELEVHSVRRSKLRANHSATHLLHAVLRKILGSHVVQKGSLVAEDRLRFDFSHPKALTQEEIFQIEHEVNQSIRENNPVHTRLMAPESAIAAGAMALFGEKYGDEVRVVTMGALSTELCGGTHVERTGEIGLFRIISEGAIAAGVRRIEALTGEEAVTYVLTQEALLREIAGSLKVAPSECLIRITALQEERKRLERALSEAKKQAFLATNTGEIRTIGHVQFIGQVVEGISAKELREVAEILAQQHLENTVIALIANTEGKAAIVIAVSPNIAATYSAVTFVKLAAEILGGSGGGGKPTFAQAGGSNISCSNAALEAIVKEISKSS